MPSSCKLYYSLSLFEENHLGGWKLGGGGGGQCSCKGGGTSLAVRDSWVESVAKVQNEEGWSVGTVSAVWWAQYAQGREHSLKHLGTWACRHLGVPLWLAGVCRGERVGWWGGGGGGCVNRTHRNWCQQCDF